jgi:outer membrane protein assembly factor BamB
VFKRNVLPVALCCLALRVVEAREAAWPGFRGPSGDGHSECRRLPVVWSHSDAGSTNIAWKQEIPGQGWSSPVLQNGRLYLTTALATYNLSLRVMALDARSGQFLWNVEVFGLEGKPSIHKKNSHASPTPLLEGNRIYAHFGPHGTACLDPAGRIVWRTTELKYPPVHGSGGSPILVDDLLIFSCDGSSDPFLVALDKKTGRVRWKTPRSLDAKKKFSFSTPLLIRVNGRPQVISQSSGAVYAYDPADGRELWRSRYDEGFSVVPRPVFAHGLLFISSSFESPVTMAIRPDGTNDVTDTHVVWRLARAAPSTPSLLVVGDELYTVSDGGIASCLDARTGRVHWQERVGGDYSASPLFAEGRIYLQNENGIGVVLKPGTNFEVLARNDVGERTLASYAVTDGAFFIRGEKHLFRVEAK